MLFPAFSFQFSEYSFQEIRHAVGTAIGRPPFPCLMSADEQCSSLRRQHQFVCRGRPPRRPEGESGQWSVVSGQRRGRRPRRPADLHPSRRGGACPSRQQQLTQHNKSEANSQQFAFSPRIFVLFWRFYRTGGASPSPTAQRRGFSITNRQIRTCRGSRSFPGWAYTRRACRGGWR